MLLFVEPQAIFEQMQKLKMSVQSNLQELRFKKKIPEIFGLYIYGMVFIP
jgi:hypothetical protein